MKRTPAEKKRLAALFRRAADIMADRRRCRYGCCEAIAAAMGESGYGTHEHDVFEDAFPWTVGSGHTADYIEHWGAGDYPEDAREARVLALHFCAVMVEAGDL